MRQVHGSTHDETAEPVWTQFSISREFRSARDCLLSRNPIRNRLQRRKYSGTADSARQRLDRAKEPPLGQRLYSTLREVPLGLDEAQLKSFCEVCATLRNDIAYFGGQRKDAMPYDDFILDLESKSHALAALYQAILLHEVGVDGKIIKAWIIDSFGSLTIKYHFVKAGLLDKRVLDPKR